jgi:tetratricopeptide (TPR) repeat protein
MAKAQQLASQGNLDPAIPLLEGLIASYRMLIWDNRAKELLAWVYMQKKDAKKAVSILTDLIATAPSKSISQAARRVYWDALLATGQNAALKKELDDAIATGGRDVVAGAQVIRGNMLRGEGRKDDALSDYVRTILFFEDAKESRPEALFKAAELLDDLQDPRADEMRKTLLKEYPDSEFAKKVAGKM